MKKVILIGSPGTGKSMVAYALQKRGMVAADIEQILVAEGIDAKEMILNGERDALQLAELQIWDNLISDLPPKNQPVVIALPADIFRLPQPGTTNFSFLDLRRQSLLETLKSEDFFVVNLQASLNKLVVRNGLVGQRSAFILLRRELRKLEAERQKVYKEIADFLIDTSEETSEAVADLICQQL